MIPSRHDYYRRRANEHRALADAAPPGAQRAMHDILVEAYLNLAREARLRQVVRLTV
jgi:hypothetical protein